MSVMAGVWVAGFAMLVLVVVVAITPRNHQ